MNIPIKEEVKAEPLVSEEIPLFMKHYPEIKYEENSIELELTKKVDILNSISDFSADNPCRFINSDLATASPLNFKCDQCFKTFTRRDNLIKHLKIHTGVKEFKCDQCNKAFTDRSNYYTSNGSYWC